MSAAVQQEWYRLLAESLVDVALVTDPDRSIIWISPSVARTLGWTPGQLVGSSMEEWFHPADAGVWAPGLEATDSTLPERSLVRARTAAGGYRWMSRRVARLADSSGVVVLLADVDSLVGERDAATLEARRRAAVVESLLDPHVLLEPVRDGERIVDFVYVDANDKACRDQGLALTDLIGVSVSRQWPAVVDAGLLAGFADVMQSGEPFVRDGIPLAGPDGQVRYYDARAVRVDRNLSLTWRDVTGRHEADQALARSEEHFRLLAENILDVIIRMVDGVVVWVSASVTTALGWLPEQFVGRPLADLVHADDAPQFDRHRSSLQEGLPVTSRFRLQAARGGYHWVESHAKPYWIADGQADGSVATLHIVDAEVAALAELDRRARYDDLTGVLKRDEAIRRLESLDRHQRRPGDECGVLFIDLDEFKEVNDTWGHAAGDAVLRTVTARVRAILRAGDTVARMGGDEFLVILEGLHSVDEAVVIAEKIRVATAEPVAVAGGTAQVTATVGATLRVRGEGADSVIARADAAMYRGKDNGRDHVVVIPPAVG